MISSKFILMLTLLPVWAVGPLLVGSSGGKEVHAFDPNTGVFQGVFATGGGLDGTGGLAFGRDGFLYVSSIATNQILRFDGKTGAFSGVFASGGPLRSPLTLAWGPDGDLYAASFANGMVIRYNPAGSIVATFVAPAGLNSPGGMAFGPNGTLYVSSTGTHQVINLDVRTGHIILAFGVGGPGGLVSPTGLTIGPDGSVYVSSAGNNQILRFNAAGLYLGVAVSSADLTNPLGLTIGPDGALYVGTLQGEVLRFDLSNGRLISRFVNAVEGRLKTPVALVFAPDALVSNEPVTISAIAGDGQETPVDTVFAEPLIVEVKREGRPAGGQSVQFLVTEGAGFVIPSPMVVTDALGRAFTRVVATLPSGPITVVATTGTSSVAFKLSSLPPPPSITGGVLHAARRTLPGMNHSQPVRGGLIVIDGKGLGPIVRVDGMIPLTSRLPDDAAGTMVRLTGPDKKTVGALIVSASENRVVALAPSAMQAGVTSVIVVYKGRPSSSVDIQLVDSNFGILTRNELGNGPASAFGVDAEGNYSEINLSRPARPGQIVAIRGTGLGPVEGGDDTPSTFAFETSGIDVLVGGVAVPAISARRFGGSPGVDEIRVQMPENSLIADGCYVPLAVRTAAGLSNFATISKVSGASAEGCDHALRLSNQMLAELDKGGSIRAGILGITRLYLDSPFGAGMFVAQGGVFAKFDANSLFVPGGITTLTVTDGACTVYQAPVQPGFQSLFPVSFGKGMNAGPSLELTSPRFQTVALPHREGSGGYDKSGLEDPSDLPVSPQGVWTFVGKGGPEVGPLTASLELPLSVTWTNKDSISEVDRNKGLTIDWGSDADGQFDKVIVSGGTFTSSDQSFQPVFVQFACSAPFNAGSLTVPAYILREMPPASDNDYFSFLAVMNSAFGTRSQAFSASDSDAKRLDATAITSILGDTKMVKFR